MSETKQEQATHTPTPWTIGNNTCLDCIYGDPELIDGRTQATFICDTGGNEYNAALIVRAVNAHDELVAALEALLKSRTFSIDFEVNRDKRTEHYHLREMIKAALAKAQGGAA